ncbi:MAG: STN domain-containing protein [Odoribacter sp.]|nr:STN domain-containing protein [Odoribacter sp.]
MKKIGTLYYRGRLIPKSKIILSMRLTFFLVLVLTFSAFTPGLSQKISVNFENVALREVFKTLKQESGLLIIYNEEEIDFNSKVNVKAENVEVEDILNQVLEKLPYGFEVVGDMVVIKPVPNKNTVTAAPQQTIRVAGVVMDKKAKLCQELRYKLKEQRLGAQQIMMEDFFCK